MVSSTSFEDESEEKNKRSATVVYPEKTIKAMRKTCRLGREVLDAAARAIRPGVTCEEIDRVVHEACIERNCYPSPLNYYTFPKSVCTSVNEVICHGIPDYRELVEGDIVNIDVTVYHDGVHGDLNETYYVGEVDDKSKHLIKVAKTSIYDIPYFITNNYHVTKTYGWKPRRNILKVVSDTFLWLKNNQSIINKYF